MTPAETGYRASEPREALGGAHRLSRDVSVALSRAQTPVSQQGLNDANVLSGFEQVRGKRMSFQILPQSRPTRSVALGP